MFDLIIEKGFIIDGSGKSGFIDDIGIIQDRIVAIGSLKNKDAHRRINAKKYVICPGFIDIHSHSDLHITKYPYEKNKLLQGVTTEVTGHCGYSSFPILKERIMLFKGIMEANNLVTPKDGYTTSQFLDNLEKKGIGVNIAPLVGHGILRVNAMGFDARIPNDSELEKMKLLLREAMEAGCFGVSTGLGYPPGCFSSTEELIELAKVISPYKGVYATHMRNQGDSLLDSINEAIKIGYEGGVDVNISHLKSYGVRNWGKAKSAIELIDNWRKKDLNIICDFYPYDAACNPLSSILPKWLHEGGRDRFIERIVNDEIRNKIHTEMNSLDDNYWNNIIISRVGSKENKILEGRNVKELSEERSCTGLDFVLDLLIYENEAVEAICAMMCEEDILEICKYQFSSVGSDAYAMPEDNYDFKGHPRNYGTFPRFIGLYVKEKNTMSLEEGIRRITSLPAEFMGIKDRGILKEGMYADIVIFDKNIIDRNSYEKPGLYPVGIEYVVINGKIQVENNKLAKIPAGRVLKKGR